MKKVKKYFRAKDSKKLIDVMFDIKSEIEAYTGQQLDIDKYLDQIEKEAKSKGALVEKAYMKEMRKRYKKQEKRSKHKALYIENCIKYDLPFNANEEEILYQSNVDSSFILKKSHEPKDKKKDDEIILPLRVTIGVTMSLVGLFLYVVPFPVCRAAAPWVLETGIAFLADQAITEWEKKEDTDESD